MELPWELYAIGMTLVTVGVGFEAGWVFAAFLLIMED